MTGWQRWNKASQDALRHAASLPVSTVCVYLVSLCVLVIMATMSLERPTAAGSTTEAVFTTLSGERFCQRHSIDTVLDTLRKLSTCAIKIQKNMGVV